MDGIERAAVSHTGSLRTSSRSLNIGSWGRGDTRRTWDGSIDDVRVHDRALTAAEILGIHGGAPPPPPVGASISTTSPGSLTEGNLNGATVGVSLVEVRDLSPARLIRFGGAPARPASCTHQSCFAPAIAASWSKQTTVLATRRRRKTDPKSYS